MNITASFHRLYTLHLSAPSIKLSQDAVAQSVTRLLTAPAVPDDRDERDILGRGWGLRHTTGANPHDIGYTDAIRHSAYCLESAAWLGGQQRDGRFGD